MANIVDTLLDLVREIEAGDWIDKRDVTKALGDAAEEIEQRTADSDYWEREVFELRTIIVKTRANNERMLSILEDAIPHARWNEKMVYPCGGENYQTWTLEIHLPVPKSCAHKSVDAALARYLKEKRDE